MSLPNFDIRSRQRTNDSENDADDDNGVLPARSRQRGAAVTASSSTWQGALGLHPRVSVLSLCALLIHFSSSILFLVFLNSLQPFYVAQLQDTPSRGGSDELPSLRIGLLTGKLAFSDELASIFLVLLWGALSDRLGISVVAAVGYCLISLGLVSYALARKPWPDLLWARLIFAGGGSAVTAMLTASLATFSSGNTSSPEAMETSTGAPADAEAVTPPTPSHSQQANEATPLLSSPSGTSAPPAAKPRHGRLASLAGLFTGLGAIVAVFLLLPLPVRLASLHEAERNGSGTGGPDDPFVQQGTREAFLIVACLALFSAASVAIGLRHPDHVQSKRERGAKRQRLSRTTSGNSATQEDDEQEEAAEARESGQLPSRLSARQARRERLRDRMQAGRGSSSPWAVTQRGLASAVDTIVDVGARSLDGFKLAGRDKTGRVALAYLGGALARGVTIGSSESAKQRKEEESALMFSVASCTDIIISHPFASLSTHSAVFLPLLISHYFYTTNPALCPPPSPGSTPSLPPSELKRTCKQAYSLTSAQSGVLQTVALILAPIVGLASDALGAEVVLGGGALMGLGAFLVYGVGLPGEGDPRVPRAWVAACVLGVTQITAIITSLSLIASLKSSSPSPSSSSSPSPAISRSSTSTRSGALAGAYSSTGALSILLLSSLGGWLFDLRPAAPFLLLAGLAGLVGVVAGLVGGLEVLRRRRGGGGLPGQGQGEGQGEGEGREV